MAQIIASILLIVMSLLLFSTALGGTMADKLCIIKASQGKESAAFTLEVKADESLILIATEPFVKSLNKCLHANKRQLAAEIVVADDVKQLIAIRELFGNTEYVHDGYLIKSDGSKELLTLGAIL